MQKRLNLWQRQKPECKENFNKEYKEKSYLRQSAENELKTTFYFTEVSYGTAYDIMSCNNLNFLGDAFNSNKYE